MRQDNEPGESADAVLRKAAAELLDAIRAEPVPQSIVHLAQRLQASLDARERRPEAAVPDGPEL